MTQWNYLLNGHFKGCQQLGIIPDPNRNRIIQVFQLPDQGDLVGYFDGVDSWIVSWHHAQLKLQGIPAPAIEGRRRVALDLIYVHPKKIIPRRKLITRRVLL